MNLRNCLILAFLIGATPMCFAGESFGFYYNVDRGGHSAGGNYQFSEPGPGPRFGPGPHHFAPPPPPPPPGPMWGPPPPRHFGHGPWPRRPRHPHHHHPDW